MSCYRFSFVGKRSFATRVHCSNLERELDKFLEQTASAGSQSIMALTPQQRFERAVKAGEIEDEIFRVRDELVMIESMALQENSIDIEKIKSLRQKMGDLKQNYADIVGADLPIYFGRIPDSFQ